MVTFKSLPKVRLRIGTHFTVMEAFNTKLSAASFTPAKLTALVTKFSEAFADEDKYLKQSRASQFSQQLAEIDDARDKAYSLIKQTVTQWASADFDPQTTAAKALLTVVNLYKIDVNAQYDQETGLLTNFLTDISTTENAANIKTLGLTDVVAKLTELNEQMKTLMADRSDERSTKVAGALKAARKQVDALYDQLTKLIESYSDTADDPTPYDEFITEWNAEVERVKQQAVSTTSATAKASSKAKNTATTTSETE